MKFMEAMELASQGIRVTAPHWTRTQYVCVDPESIKTVPMDRLHRWFWPDLAHSQYLSGTGHMPDTLDGLADWSVWIEPKKDMWGQPYEPSTGEPI